MKVELMATPYTRKKKGDTKRLRNSDSIPAVIYGHGEESRAVAIDRKSFKRITEILQQEAVMLEISLMDMKYLCVIKSVQHNPMTGDILHVDFQHIHSTEKIKTTVPIHLLGTAPGIKKGGILDQHLHEVVVKCLPDEIPGRIDIDISSLDLHQTIHLYDIKKYEKMENVEFEPKMETPVVSLVVPRAVEEAVKPAAAVEEAVAEEAVAEGAEPEKEKDKAGKKEPDKAGKKEPDKPSRKE